MEAIDGKKPGYRGIPTWGVANVVKFTGVIVSKKFRVWRIPRR